MSIITCMLELTFGPCLYSSEALLCDWPVGHLDLGAESCQRKERSNCMYMLGKHLVYMCIHGLYDISVTRAIKTVHCEWSEPTSHSNGLIFFYLMIPQIL